VELHLSPLQFLARSWLLSGSHFTTEAVATRSTGAEPNSIQLKRLAPANMN